MEIKVNIPKNDYKEPTDVRQEVVQCICDIIINVIKSRSICRIEVLSCDDLLTTVFIDKRTDHNLIRSTYGTIKEAKDKIIVRGCEMKAAFNALTNADYYISSAWETETKHVYYFTDRFDKHNNHTRSFTDFID